MFVRLLVGLCAVMCWTSTLAAQQAPDTRRGDAMLNAYFAAETARLRDACLADVNTLDDWLARRDEYRRQLQDMLGLDPWPEKTDLSAAVTGRVEKDDYVVENLHFQSLPGLYVTANLYLPRNPPEKKLPAILYLCGHGRVVKDGVSYGNKTHYHHHGVWFARNGYACLTIDTLQLGEIEGHHHGTHRLGMWWWLNRNYTPAGVEAWNCIRALDYLQSRPEIDGERIGATGRSGGGAYSWWIAALDERIKAAVPVAGITDLENHVVDGCVEGHCDCMYFVNTYQWDYPLVAALVAPRPLIISNTDRDGIFPLEGVVRTHALVRKIYRLHGKPENLALHITAGPHQDTQELRIHAFRWFNQHLKGDTSLIEIAAAKVLEPEELQVFRQGLPAERRNEVIHETFVAAAPEPSVPASQKAWEEQRDGWLAALREKSFGGWPATSPPLDVEPAWTAEHAGVRLSAFDFTSQEHVRLRLFVLQRATLDRPQLTVLNVLDQPAWNDFLALVAPAFADELAGESLPEPDAARWESTRRMLENQPWAMAYVAPRGVGPTLWSQAERKEIQIRRRFYLLGQTADGQRVWDVRRAVAALRDTRPYGEAPIWLQSHRTMAGVSLYAAIFEPGVARLDLYDLPASHRDGPILLNVNRTLDLPAAVAVAAENSQVVIYQAGESGWEYPRAVVEQLGWNARQLQLRAAPAAE